MHSGISHSDLGGLESLKKTHFPVKSGFGTCGIETVLSEFPYDY